jgi:hypothetical protein
MLNTRIYLSLILPNLSDRRVNYFLSYLKLRAYCQYNKSYGNVKRSSIPAILQLSESTSKKHTQYLESIGYVLCKGESIRVVSSLKCFDSNKKNHYVKIDLDKINSFSWKNIAEFKAYLSECVFQKQENYKQALTRGFYKYDYRSKVKEKIKDLKYVSFKERLSIICAAKTIGVSIRTIQRYREKQSVSTYSWKLEYINPEPTNDSQGVWIDDMVKHGKVIVHNDKLFYSPISKRKSDIIVYYR